MFSGINLYCHSERSEESENLNAIKVFLKKTRLRRADPSASLRMTVGVINTNLHYKAKNRVRMNSVLCIKLHFPRHRKAEAFQGK